MDRIDKIVRLINLYRSLTPMGLAWEGMALLTKIENLCKTAKEKEAVKDLLFIGE